MIVVQLHQLLQFLIDKNGHDRLLKAVTFAIDQRRAEAGFDGQRREFLRHMKLDTLFTKAVDKKVIHDCEALALVLQALQIRGDDLFAYQERRAPWDTWVAGRKVVIILGGKFAKLNDAPLENQVVGGQDAKALRVLERVLRDHAGIPYVSETIHLSPKTSAGEAERGLQKLLRMKDVGAIVVLGSEIVNPLAAPVARRIFRGLSPRDVPLHFRWSYPHGIQKPFLAGRRLCAPENEGIALSHEEDRTSLPRIGDQAVVQAMNRGRLGPFADCGILGLSAHEEKFLVLCSGHGGCGTTAAVHGLGRVDYVEKRLLESFTQAPGYPPAGTLLEPIWVKRSKKSTELIDDFEFDESYGLGWKFYFDDEDELDFDLPRPEPEKEATG